MSGANLLFLTLAQLVLTAMPGIAAALVAIRLGARDVPVLLGVALAGSGVAAMLVFWVYLALPGIGSGCALAVFFASLVLAIWSSQAVHGERDLLRRLAVPLALWALATVFIVFFGFLHGGSATALETAMSRFSTQPSQLASDNFIPHYFADWVYHGSPGSPPIFEPGWLFSDRPPLQIGYLLSQRPFGWDATTLHSELIGVAIQQFWVVGLWALLSAARVSPRTRSLTMVAALLSDVVIVNGFFVWPKLLAAAFVLAALALVVAPREPTLRARPATAVLLGLLVGLAFLSHGSSVFGLIPLAVLAVARGLPSWRWLVTAAAATLVLVLPWTAYQHYGDPPGNRVVKWALAGVTEIDGQSVGGAIIHSYRQAGIGGTLENKLENFLTMAGGGPDTKVETEEWIHFGSAFTDTTNAVRSVGEGRFGVAASFIRESRFSHLLWSLGLLILGLPIALFGRYRGRGPGGEDWRFAGICLFVFGLGALLWGLLLFGNVPSRAIITEGTLALPILGIAGLVAALGATYPRWAAWLVGANVTAVALLYLPSLSPIAGSSYSAFAGLVAAVCLLAYVFAAFRLSPPGGSATGVRRDD